MKLCLSALAQILLVMASVPSLANTPVSKQTADSTTTLVLAWDHGPSSFDPRFIGNDDRGLALEQLIHCSLITFDKNGVLIPSLAESWSWTSSTTLLVNLKANARFRDGSKVSAADVVATYDFLKRTPIPSAALRGAGLSSLVSVAAGSPGSVVFTLRQPDSSFLSHLSLGILPQSVASGDKISQPSAVNGCGPYGISSVTGKTIELAKNRAFALSTPARSNKVIIRLLANPAERLAKLKRGDIDLLQNDLEREDLESLAKTNPNLRIERRIGLNTSYVGFNMKDPVLSHLKVRQAISMAINRSAIIGFALKGLAQPASSLILPQNPFFNRDLRPALYNPKRAAALLDEAGFKPQGPQKMRFSLVYKTTHTISRVTIGKAIAADLRTIGIDTSVEALEPSRFKSDIEQGKVQLWGLNWSGYRDPDILRHAFATENFPPFGANRGHYSNSNVDQLLNEARNTTDEGKRMGFFHAIQRIVADELPYTFLWHEEIAAVINKDVQGFEVYADGSWAGLKDASKSQ